MLFNPIVNRFLAIQYNKRLYYCIAKRVESIVHSHTRIVIINKWKLKIGYFQPIDELENVIPNL